MNQPKFRSREALIWNMLPISDILSFTYLLEILANSSLTLRTTQNIVSGLQELSVVDYLY